MGNLVAHSRFEQDQVRSRQGLPTLSNRAVAPFRSSDPGQWGSTGPKSLSEVAFKAAAEIALRGAKPRTHNAFKIELARRIVTRALSLAAVGTPDRVPALPASPFAPVP